MRYFKDMGMIEIGHKQEQVMMNDYALGKQASIAGLPISACFYMPHTQADRYDAWVCGWLDEEGPTYKVKG